MSTFVTEIGSPTAKDKKVIRTFIKINSLKAVSYKQVVSLKGTIPILWRASLPSALTGPINLQGNGNMGQKHLAGCRVYSRNWPVKVFLSFSRKGVQERGSLKRYSGPCSSRARWPLAPWHPTFAPGWLENLRFFIQIICWAPWILQVQSTGHPSIFLRAQPWYLNLLVQTRLFHEKMNVYLHFAAILEHSGQLKKLGLELL